MDADETDNVITMSEHGFLAAMLAFVAFMAVMEVAVLGYFTYRIARNSERIEGLTAATYLEARKALERLR